jgi:hypothetical protein
MRSAMTALAAAAFVAGLSTSGFAAAGWQAQVAEAIGKPGTELPGGIYKVALPRTDLRAKLDGIALQPGFALGGWLAFTRMGGSGMVMGDLVLTENEVNPVMAKLAEGGILVTGLHNHLLRNRPFTMYLHVFGKGDPVKLAAALRTALAASHTPISAAMSGSSQPATKPPVDLDTAAIDRILGAKGRNDGGVYQIGIPRADTIREDGMAVPPAMGVANSINFQPTGGGKATITGDFVLTANEVNPVLKALREHGIEVTAIHNHMLGEQPRLFFLHFWGDDDAQQLAQGLKAALVHINVRKG